MKLRNNNSNYGSLSIGLHWFMLILIVAVYACMELRDIFPKGSQERDAMKTWHYMLGMSVLLFALARVIIRATQTAPIITPEPANWQKILAKLMKISLYVLMIGMPIAGWLILSAKGKTVPFFGLQLPMLIGENKSTAGLIKEAHETAATIGYFLIGLHALAALFHHYIIKDNTLIRMLPRRD
ncbi:cytochrome b [Undibacterium sp. RTI2.1]|uniref:cytochrome b n=1 Tax=unclassified Undibacterium TaxID=2630295 RepID=UPI002AB51039|nr:MULTISPECIES: cytochrome b [unclassified Undibacterium]MDY7537390.1 cytochrome b [Undibacterium sp. 5I1]MEB0031223.1 cytochrome b [Undibacterium sp. RTI2.1]MEB0117603.1 cytochrome b [Undibacterium sp. RTI2.2]MEB0232011.1 cytochrome b [Undibacterium sp. 10I3]MEB0259320.1 cytochrome b [Undibacterium sp. 5I1]